MALKFNEFIQIKEAAELLGVSQVTLRVWEEKGKIASYRSPMNEKKRLYIREELLQMLEDIQPKKAESETNQERDTD